MKKWLPTTKWWMAAITTAATITNLLWDGINTTDEKKTVVGMIAALLLSYVARNQNGKTGSDGQEG